MSSRPMSAPAYVPFGWQTAKAFNHLSLVLPRNPTSMHWQLHKNLNPKFRREDTEKNKDGSKNCVKVLHTQRVSRRCYSAQLPRSRKQVSAATQRLAHYNPSFKPADSDRAMLAKRQDSKSKYHLTPFSKPLYSHEEVQTIVDRLYYNPKNPERKLNLKFNKKFYTADQVDNIVNSVQNKNSMFKQHGRRQCLMHAVHDREEEKHEILLGQKRYTEADVAAITDRLAKYDPMKCPPNSKESQDAQRKPEPREDGHLLPQRKKYSAAQVNEIFKRLSTYDPEKWPPESKHRAKEDIPERTYFPKTSQWSESFMNRTGFDEDEDDEGNTTETSEENAILGKYLKAEAGNSEEKSSDETDRSK